MSSAQPLDVFTCELDGINLIEASAGTGKTWSIAALYARLLLERGLPVRDILVVTFTKTATAELRDRLRRRLASIRLAIQTGSSDDPFVTGFLRHAVDAAGLTRQTIQERLDEALAAFDEASIHTIHSYCQRALMETPFSAALPLSMELDTDETGHQQKVADDFWRTHCGGPGVDRGFALHLLATKALTPETLQRQLAIRTAHIDAVPEWGAVPDSTSTDDSPLLHLYDELRTEWRDMRDPLLSLLTDALPAMNGRRLQERWLLPRAAKLTTYFAQGNPYLSMEQAGGWMFLETFSQDFLAGAMKSGRVAPQHSFFTRVREFHALLLEMMPMHAARAHRLMVQWVTEGPALLADHRRSMRVQSYQDQLTGLRDALAGPRGGWLADTLRRRHPCALIDEFQDTDPIQFDIFRRIHLVAPGESTVFFVGDPKQAIYSFRGADLHTYLQARRQAVRRYTLDRNQRSSDAFITAVNHLFSVHDDPFMFQDLEYTTIHPGEHRPEPLTDDSADRAPMTIWNLTPDTGDDPPTRGRLRAIAAATAADEIARLLAEGARGNIRIGGRAIVGADIAVLVRTNSEGMRMRQVLTDRAVGCVELSQTSVWATPQAGETLRILETIHTPGDPGLVASALGTEILGASSDHLAALLHDDDAMERAMALFRSLHEEWRRHGFAAMWRRLLRSDGALGRIAAGPEGERTITNLTHIGELIQAGASADAAPEHILRMVHARMRSDSIAGEDEQLRLESDENLVRITTMHSAKGLEYPIVFCPFLFDAAPPPRTLPAAWLHHDAQGQARISFTVGTGSDTKSQARAGAFQEHAQEHLRLLYVALTRAIHRCHVMIGRYTASRNPRECCTAMPHWLVAGDGTDHTAFLAGSLDWDAILGCWQRVAAGSGGTIDLHDAPVAPEATAPPTRAERGLRCAIATGPYHAAWIPGSYSSLTTHAAQDRPIPDRDAQPSLPAWGAVPEHVPEDDILRFPRGAAAGNCIHRLLERIDFADPAGWNEAIGTAAWSLTGRMPQEGSATPEVAMLASMLRDLTATEILPGFTLAAVPRTARLNEMEFQFPSPRFDSGTLSRLLMAHGLPVDDSGFMAWRRLLSGYIDSVIRHDNRYYIVDWKSNHLGHAPTDYDARHVADAMRMDGYHLQYLIYSVALRRHLRLRMRAYDEAAHFGGCLYLFVRGVRPGWRSATGEAFGVFHHRPDPATLDALESLIAEPGDRS